MAWFTQIAGMIFCIWPDRHRQRRALRKMDDDQLHEPWNQQRRGHVGRPQAILATTALSRKS